MADRYVLQVYDVQISALFDAMGVVGKPMTRLQREVFAQAVADAPMRSGELKAGHRNHGARKAGSYRIRGFIENVSDHAAYVHEGTHGPIMSPEGRYMIVPNRAGGLPMRRGGSGMIRKVAVRGQAANPWMTNAGRKVLSRHGISHT